MTTIHDVAKAAGVSIATVSARINASAPVSQTLARRVDMAIERTGYRPNALARGLKTGATLTLGLAVDALADPTSAAIAQAVVRAADAQGYAVILASGTADRDLAALEARRVEGMVLVPVPAATRGGGTRRESGVPAVILGGLPDDAGAESIGVDYAQAADAAVEHLAALGHGRIALVIGHDHVPQGERILEGYRRTLARHGVRFLPRLVRVAAQGSAKSRLDGGGQARETARALLAAPEWPTAIVVCGSSLALGMMSALAAAGLACPTALSMVALNDADWMAHAPPPLTAVAEPAREMGSEAVRLLLERRRDGAVAAPRRVLLPGALIVRGSTAPPSAAV
jgi:LacI family transcriptional regulator